MITSKDVFAKRREGALDEAYRMALQLMSAPDKGEWDIKAFAWCLIDLIKRDVQSGQQQNIEHYRQQLEATSFDPNDNVLQKNVNYTLSLCNPNSHLISQAKTLSKQGKHFESASIYRRLHAKGVADTNVQTGLAWELYKLSKELIGQTNLNLNGVKKNLNDYLKLEVEKPSLLHSCFLQLALKLAGEDRFSMLVFARLWNLDYLRQDDYDRFVSDDGKVYPSLAEKVIQQASKEAGSSNNKDDLNYILPHLDKTIAQYPDNIWLKLNKAKVLIALSRNDDALAFGLEVVKSKINDYWAWELLGDICADSNPDAALSCYSKALLCSSDERFIGKVRLKLAQRLLEAGELANAKYELLRIVANREREGQKIPEDVTKLTSQAWYAEIKAADSNLTFYKANTERAESLLFSKMPWINANMGDMFVIPGKENKPKRKLFVKTSSVPLEVSVLESEFKFHDLDLGDTLRVKGEFDTNKIFQVYVIEKRDSEIQWDIFSERIGVVDHINKEKKLIHFLVDRNLDGIVLFSELTGSFMEGDAIAVKLSRYTSKQGERYRVLQATATDQSPSTSVRKQFVESVRAECGMGFTSDDIFIPPPLMNKHHIEDGDVVSGVALLNYNKKRNSWGWKAVVIEKDNGEVD